MNFLTISAKEIDNFLYDKDVVIIDVRPTEDYRIRHIKNAVHISYSEFDQEDFEAYLRLPKNKTLLLYCERGSTSMMIAKQLAEKGYKVISVVGGIQAYRGKNIVRASTYRR